MKNKCSTKLNNECEEKKSNLYMGIVMIAFVVFVFGTITWILLKEPTFNDYIKNPNSWGKAMSDPLSR